MNEVFMIYYNYELDLRAKIYIKERIKYGKSISQNVLNMIEYNKGKVYAYLPKGISEKELYSFNDGFIGLDRMITYEFTLKKISDFLSASRNSLVIFENSCFSKRKESDCAFESNTLFYGEEAYHYLLSKHNNLETIKKTLNESYNAWQNIFFMTYLQENDNDEKISIINSNIIKKIAQNTEKIVLDAYDLDGYLYWDMSKDS